MAPELDTSVFPPRWVGSNFKGPRGAATVAKEKADAKVNAGEIDIAKLVRARDVKCRCPLKHKCRGGLEVIHIVDRSRGGPYVTTNLWLGCVWIHRRGPVTIHSKDIEIRPLTKRGADGPCAFYLKRFSETRAGEYTWRLIAKESAPGVFLT